MDLGLNRRRKEVKIISDDLKDLYPHDMTFYRIPPTTEIPLDEFEELAVDRLKVLRIIEIATHKGHRPFSTEWKSYVHSEVQKEEIKKFMHLIKPKSNAPAQDLDYQSRRADHISHFILRLAYCRSNELRKWFLGKELDLFKMRFMDLTQASILKFLELNNLNYQPVSEESKIELREELMESTQGAFMFDAIQFYVIPFNQVLSLVKNRRLFVRDGFAYVPSFELVTCMSTIFRASLSESLALACKKLPFLNDERINVMLMNLHHMYLGNDDYRNVQSQTTEVNLANLSIYAKKHFPLCMRHIYDVLHTNHHLKHGCRLQYQLFLKGIGLSYDDCYQYWKDEFTKLIDGNSFDKQYSYSIKHSYGKVGKMQNYAPHNCMKIISYSIGSGELHGCPFKHWDVSTLTKKLEESGMSSKGVSEILDFTEKRHFQLACGKYYEHTHGGENKNYINHPNQYFLDSFTLANDEAQK